ncbi:DUF4364 family protein [Clostridium cylindrosporum]|uniref:DUF4364 family protein n=1 Tax=Clostridium cylindrosporum DSM 605 TaxID=1121307 RepID=A0A0J8DEL8_CLOCY|nr:DUF4364 family protein [Clostridium cylindrosporum]KMT22684.1 hypothetical protein CLCY_11c00180 [Clostridium cylindrosporum DSM 605]
MFKDTSELAENKLLLLYILSKLQEPTSNTHITHVVLENNLINYFSLQQYLSELIDNGFISDSKEDKTHKLTLTEPGRNTLEFFINRIPIDKISLIDKYIESSDYNKKNVQDVSASFEKRESDTLVILKIKGKDSDVMSLNISVDDEDDATKICDTWREKGPDLYEDILSLLKEK